MVHNQNKNKSYVAWGVNSFVFTHRTTKDLKIMFFSSDKLTFEFEVQMVCEMIQNVTYKYTI